MPDTTTPAPQTDPLAPGSATTEFKMTRIVVIAGVVLAVLSAIGDALNSLLQVMPGNPLITKIGMVIGILASTLTSVLYSFNRTAVKKAVITQPVIQPSNDEAKNAMTS